jgi:hypothetical protein
MVGCERDGTEHALLELIEPDEPRRLFLADLPSPLRAAARRNRMHERRCCSPAQKLYLVVEQLLELRFSRIDAQ